MYSDQIYFATAKIYLIDYSTIHKVSFGVGVVIIVLSSCFTALSLRKIIYESRPAKKQKVVSK